MDDMWSAMVTELLGLYPHPGGLAFEWERWRHLKLMVDRWSGPVSVGLLWLMDGVVTVKYSLVSEVGDRWIRFRSVEVDLAVPGAWDEVLELLEEWAGGQGGAVVWLE